MSILRLALYLICAVQLVFAAALYQQLPFAVALWPFPGTTPLTFILLASFFAAAAASTFWAAASGNDGALAGISLDYIAIFAPLAVLGLQLGAAGSPGAALFSAASALGALFGVGLLLWSLRVPLDRSIPMPGLVRGSFVVFVLALLLVSVRLLTITPNILPWTITSELSLVTGWMFFGAATYFLYALLRPSWANAAGQLAGFLAYDLVLIVPLLTRLPTVASEHRVGMILYIAVVSYSGLLAIYYLFLHPPTRLMARMPTSRR